MDGAQARKDVDQIQNPKEKGCLNAMKQLTKWMESRQDIAKSPQNPKSQEKGCKGCLSEGMRVTVMVNAVKQSELSARKTRRH